MSTPVFVLSNICLIKSVSHQRCSWGLDLFGFIWSLFFHQFIVSFYASALHSYMRQSLMVRIAFLSQQWEFKYFFDFRVPFIFCISFIDPTAWVHSSPSLKNYAGSCRGEDVIFLSARDDGCARSYISQENVFTAGHGSVSDDNHTEQCLRERRRDFLQKVWWGIRSSEQKERQFIEAFRR